MDDGNEKENEQDEQILSSENKPNELDNAKQSGKNNKSNQYGRFNSEFKTNILLQDDSLSKNIIHKNDKNQFKARRQRAVTGKVDRV